MSGKAEALMRFLNKHSLPVNIAAGAGLNMATEPAMSRLRAQLDGKDPKEAEPEYLKQGLLGAGLGAASHFGMKALRNRG